MTSTVVPGTLEPGQEIPRFQRTTGLHHWNRFAAVNDEFVDIHMDDAAGRAAGYSGAFGMGNLQWAYLHNVLRDWIGDGGRLVRVVCQFRGPNLRGATVTARGTITAVHDEQGETLVELDVWTEDADGTKIATGQATIALAGGAP